MRIRVKASTKLGHTTTIEEIDKLSGKMAGICYMPDDYDTLENEDEAKTSKRAINTKLSGHHSVYQHGKVTFIMEGIPKLFAMLLNNEKDFDTSEKSARYTKMVLSPREQALYDKWLERFKVLIKDKYGNIPYFSDYRIGKLAAENARYLTSVMTPTTMAHTLDVCQLNYICHWLEKMPEHDDTISKMLAPTALEFVEHIKELGLYDTDLKDNENRYFSLIGKRVRGEQYGEAVSLNFETSLANYAQFERHRTLSFEMKLPDNKKFYLPKILLSDDKLVKEWQQDMESVSDLMPQGELVEANVRGTYENLISLASKRLCTAAQLEAANLTNDLLVKVANNTTNEEVKQDVSRVMNHARCVSGYPCTKPCGFKEGIDLTREI